MSRRHHTCSRIDAKSVGVAGGAGIPRASAEYRWWWAQTKPGVVALIGASVRPDSSVLGGRFVRTGSRSSRTTLAATKRSSFGASKKRVAAWSATSLPARTASAVAAVVVLTAWAWTISAEVPSSSAAPLQRLAGAAHPEIAGAGVDCFGLADPGVPLVAPGPVGLEHGPQRQPQHVGIAAPVGVPAGGVGVGQPVRDVEPAEVVVEVDLAGHVVAQHAHRHGGDDRIQQAVDAGAVVQRVDRGAQRGGAIALVEQGRHEAAVVAPRGVGVDRGEGVEVEPAEAATKGRMYGSVSSRVPYTIVGTRWASTVSARSHPRRSRSWNAFWA